MVRMRCQQTGRFLRILQQQQLELEVLSQILRQALHPPKLRAALLAVIEQSQAAQGPVSITIGSSR